MRLRSTPDSPRELGGVLDEVKQDGVEHEGLPEREDAAPAPGLAVRAAARLEEVERLLFGAIVAEEESDLGRVALGIAGAGEQSLEGLGNRAVDPNVEGLEEEVEVRLVLGFPSPKTARVRGPRRWPAPSVAAVAPLADLGDELQVAQELVVDEVVVASQVPQRSDHVVSTLRANSAARGDHWMVFSKCALKFSNSVRGFPREFILMYRSSGLMSSPHRTPVRQRQEEKPDRRVLGVGQPRPRGWRRRRREPLVDRIEHHEHRLDGRVVPPDKQVPGLVRDPPRRRRIPSGSGLLDEALAEHPGALPGGVGEVASSRGPRRGGRSGTRCTSAAGTAW